jgi:hypothetical protein
MQTRPQRTVTQHATARGTTGLNPSTGAAVNQRIALNGAATVTSCTNARTVGTDPAGRHLLPSLLPTPAVTAAQPFRYGENRWVQLISSPDHRARH